LEDNWPLHRELENHGKPAVLATDHGQWLEKINRKVIDG